MSAEEVRRYDRQIRLWGKGTQQRLMLTHVFFKGIRGEAAEVAKNLALAGVKAITVEDAEPVGSAERHHNFLLQEADPAVGCAEGAGRALQRLNPHVKVRWVSAAAAAEPSVINTELTVAVVQARSLPDVAAAVKRYEAMDLLTLTITCGAGVLSLFLYRKLGVPFGEQAHQLLFNVDRLTEKPVSFQKVVLLLHLRDAAALPSFAGRLLAATDLVQRLELFEMEAQDVEEVVRASLSSAEVGAVTATLGGATVAQHIVRQIGAQAAEADREAYQWMTCEAGNKVQNCVGFA